VHLVLNKALLLWEDKFIASSDSLREMLTRTEQERSCVPVCCLPRAGLRQGDLLRASSSSRLWFWAVWVLWRSFLAVPQPSLFYLLSRYFRQRGNGEISA